jgi:prepilin-type N-terminal cleavage/methylation domain-containing protein
MNAMKNKLPIFDCQFSNEMESDGFVCPSIGNRQSQIKNSAAFTLIELLVVISIIGVLAALLFPVFSAVKKHALINHAQAEMAQLETAIDNYKSNYGFYPPGNANNPAINQLYYELTGTTNLANGDFESLDGSSTVSSNSVNGFFGVGGFMNCSKIGAGEDAPKAKDFLPDLKSNQIGSITNGASGPGNSADLIVSSIDWPTAAGAQIDVQSHNNPWRYNSSSPTNNPGAYDLWLQILIKPGLTNLICNWSGQVQINSPLP